MYISIRCKYMHVLQHAIIRWSGLFSKLLGPELQPMVVDTPVPFSHGVVMTTGGGAEAERNTCQFYQFS